MKLRCCIQPFQILLFVAIFPVIQAFNTMTNRVFVVATKRNEVYTRGFRYFLTALSCQNDLVGQGDIVFTDGDIEDNDVYNDGDDTAITSVLIPDEGSPLDDVVSANVKDKVEEIIKQKVKLEMLHISKIVWVRGRLEITVSETQDIENPIGPIASKLENIHRAIYNDLEALEGTLNFLSRFEILVASPGVADTLRSDRDFISFKGFMVSVMTTEMYKKKICFEGTLVERTDEFISISLKGRIVKIPRSLVQEVKLPKAKYESMDFEIRKLRK